MLKKVVNVLIALCLIFIIAGCNNKSIIDESKNAKMAMEQPKGEFEVPLSDSDIIKEILLSFSEEEGEPDYNEARTKLENFIQDYPASKWAGFARFLILTMDNMLTLQEKVQTQSFLLDQANKDKEKIKKDAQLTDKIYRLEISRLQQEIELLKKDIAILKRLEIQLDRREKMLK